MIKMSVESIINWLSDQENYTDYIIGKLVPKNKIILSADTIVREDIRFKDMAIEYAFDIPLPGDRHISLLINKNVIEHFNLSPARLYDHALRNAEKTYICVKMDDVLKGAFPDKKIENTQSYILSAYNNYYGAFVMCNDRILTHVCHEVCNFEDDLAILPCSKHELIVLPKGEFPISLLKELVYECNRTETIIKDSITDRVYIWERCTATLVEI